MESVLIVDDEKDNLEALRRLLRHEFQVTTTESGMEALKLLATQEFSAIVSDQRMPQITGVDLLEKAKLLRPATTRILLTGYTEVESVIGAINRGNIYRYIAKPWDPDDLKITLRQATESYRLKKDLEDKNQTLERTNADLQSALENLKMLDRAKARFLSLVSHELNTPLTTLSAFIELLSEKQDGLSEEVRKAIASLSTASNRFSEIVSDVIAYVRLESDDNVEYSSFDWDKQIVQITQTLESLRAQRQVDVAVQGKGGIRTSCDVERMKQAVQKLLREAITRSQSGDRVEILVKPDKQFVSVKVSWRGAPLPTSALDAFETGGDIFHHHKNLALGLAIAKRVFEKHGGTLKVDSAAGATCLVGTLPQA